ncbi:hypothetical protein CSV65_16335 [Sporosarcina sp. P31]|nr:hypothetical protein CSV66_16280 [Sporosarcina sp. P30]PID07412.1 hypothetical protein CSV65_16335 [Sporosarcina sp. P31]
MDNSCYGIWPVNSMKFVIVIGKPLKLSPAFPPLHTVRETFTSYGVPTNPIRFNHQTHLNLLLRLCSNSFVSISRYRP